MSSMMTCNHFEKRLPHCDPLAEEAGVAGHLLEELDVFKHEVEHLGSSAWERKEGRDLSRNELVRLSLAMLRASSSRSG